MVRFILNATEVQAEEGSTILQVAEAHNINIPTLCNNKALEPAGLCRLCTVRVSRGSWSKLVTSCNYPVEEGLEVVTHSEEINKHRKMIVELLLARCPNNDFVKNLAAGYGVFEPRFVTDDDDCILCGLCVRMCEKMGPRAIDFSGRGTGIEVSIPFRMKPEVCAACGACASICPTGRIKVEDITDRPIVPIPAEFDEGLGNRKPINVPYAQAVPNTPFIDRTKCAHFVNGGCKVCAEFCPTGAIDHTQVDEEIELDVGAVIFAPGFKTFDPKRKPEYGYGRWPNVMTSIEYERMLSASGPFGGHIHRLSDGEKPNRVAWIQCVGSRDSEIGQDYCSYVCCMYATKQAMITKEHEADIDTTIFYIDMRAQGKGFDRFYERARDETGVRYVRSMISRIVPVPESDRLLVGYSDSQNALREEEFDLIVLSVGLCAHPSTAELARTLGVKLNAHGFTETDPMDIVATSQPGIYVCGAAQGPKDIPDSVQQGSSAAACATSLLSEVRGSLIDPPPKYEERDVRGEKPRIGVFVCHCGINIAGTVDVEAVVGYAKTLPGVEYAFHPMFACSTDQQKEIRRAIDEYKLNRFVVASCTPRTHEPLFRNTLREAGLNPYLFELANIREHDSWVHQGERGQATEKAKDLVRMAVSRVSLLEPLYDYSYQVVQKALVIGGGLAGLTAALSVAEQGFPAVLVEKTEELGGNSRNLFYTEDGADPYKYVEELIRKVESNKLITVYREAEVVSVKGACGNFSTTISIGGKEIEVSHGVGIVATGGREYKPTEYLYGQDKRVLTQKEFEKLLVEDPSAVKNLSSITMIQCVGSREPENSYCSRVCCTSAIKNSIKLKEINPGANISVLYRDIRSFGFKELAYQEARRRGVRFFRFEEDQKPVVGQNGGGLEVSFHDAQLLRPITVKSDLVVLSAAIRPAETTAKLAETLRLPLDQDGFFLEAHLKLRPLDFATGGFFLCGLAQGPKFANESIAQARGAVSRAATILSQKEIVAEGVVTQVDPALCRACGECEQTCLFDAIKVTLLESGKRQAMVTQALCTGCGACNAACPTGAASLAHFRDKQIEAVIQAL